MLFQAGSDGEDIWVEDYVVRGETGALGQKIVSALTNFDSSIEIVSLTSLIKGHHDDGGTVASNKAGLTEKLIFAILQAD